MELNGTLMQTCRYVFTVYILIILFVLVIIDVFIAVNKKYDSIFSFKCRLYLRRRIFDFYCY